MGSHTVSSPCPPSVRWRAWSGREHELLRKWRNLKTAAQLALMLGRSEFAVKAFARRNRIVKRKAVCAGGNPIAS